MPTIRNPENGEIVVVTKEEAAAWEERRQAFLDELAAPVKKEIAAKKKAAKEAKAAAAAQAERERAEKFEGELRDQALRAWPGTREDFERAWENGLRDAVLGDATRSQMEERRRQAQQDVTRRF